MTQNSRQSGKTLPLVPPLELPSLPPMSSAIIIMVLSEDVVAPVSPWSLSTSSMRSSSLKISSLLVTISIYARSFDNVNVL